MFGISNGFIYFVSCRGGTGICMRFALIHMEILFVLCLVARRHCYCNVDGNDRQQLEWISVSRATADYR